MEPNFKQNERYETARKRVKDIKGFYVHLIVYVFVNAFFIGWGSDWDFAGGSVSIGGYHTALFWGIGLAAHALSVFGPNIFLGKDWEERKIKHLMDKDKRQTEKWD